MESLKHPTVHVSEILRTFMHGYATALPGYPNLLHTSSMTSINSKTSDRLIDADNNEVATDNTRFGYWPFIYKVSHLNLPELHWLIIGSIASLVFGGVAPVRLVRKSFFLSPTSSSQIAIDSCLLCFFPMSTNYLPNKIYTKPVFKPAAWRCSSLALVSLVVRVSF
jgi:hypothetical protein